MGIVRGQSQWGLSEGKVNGHCQRGKSMGIVRGQIQRAKGRRARRVDLQDLNVANMEQVKGAVNIHNLGMGIRHVAI